MNEDPILSELKEINKKMDMFESLHKEMREIKVRLNELVK